MDLIAMLSLDEIRKDLDRRESSSFSTHAALSRNGIRRIPENRFEEGYRQNFSLDADRIIHSLSYTRYIDKTQVFYLIKNDHITHRVLHVQLVSKAARTIGRFLGLNEDLIEAIALAHDIGHAPFGHEGEHYLSAICKRHGIGAFHHNIQSVHFLENVERKGRGLNLCLQTLDGILCHDGEIHNQSLVPNPEKTFEDLDREIAARKKNAPLALVPMTLEGCVVRMADTISYIGRDIEDAIRLGMINRSELPPESVACLGETNGTIVYHLVTDIIQNSYGKPFIAFSPEISEALKRLKAFNYERIYLNPEIKKESAKIETLFDLLFDQHLNDLTSGNMQSVIYADFLKGMSEEYSRLHSPAEIVRDFIAGMTDHYFLSQCPGNLRPEYRSR